jgi:hypothetical protein
MTNKFQNATDNFESDKYRAQAEAVESAGYHRLAATLRELADTYERDAERIVSREIFDV